MQSVSKQHSSIIARKKSLKLSIDALLNEKSTNSQFVSDYGTGRTFFVQDTTQRAFREYLRRQKSPVTIQPDNFMLKNSFCSAWDLPKHRDKSYTQEMLAQVVRKDYQRKSKEIPVRKNGDPVLMPYSIKASKRRSQLSPYEALRLATQSRKSQPSLPKSPRRSPSPRQETTPQRFIVRHQSNRIRVQLRPQMYASSQHKQLPQRRKALMLVDTDNNDAPVHSFNEPISQRRVKRQIQSQHRLFNNKLRSQSPKSREVLPQSHDEAVTSEAIIKMPMEPLHPLQRVRLDPITHPSGLLSSSMHNSIGFNSANQKTSPSSRASAAAVMKESGRMRAGSLRDLTTSVAQFFQSKPTQNYTTNVVPGSSQSQLDNTSFKQEVVTNLLSVRMGDNSSFATGRRNSKGSDSCHIAKSLSSLQVANRLQLGTSMMTRRARMSNLANSIDTSSAIFERDIQTSSNVKVSLMTKGRTLDTRNLGLNVQSSTEKKGHLTFKKLRGILNQQKSKRRIKSPRFLNSKEQLELSEDEKDCENDEDVSLQQCGAVNLGTEDSCRSLFASMNPATQVRNISPGLLHKQKRRS